MTDDEDDPFADLGVDDREGDPFETLGGPPDTDDESGGTADAPSDADPPDAGDPQTESPRGSPDTETGSTSASVAGPSTADEFGLPVDTNEADADSPPTRASSRDPFDGMAERGGDPFGGSGESVFESVDVESVDADEVWASLDEDAPTDSEGESRYAEVSKHRYCEQCEYFSAPPDVHCTKDGTEIVEFLDVETVKLLDCPVVAEQRELGNAE
ncbi:hypothetical protein [Haloarcula marina]|uniref:hypothetical protein n=1 Tax=Haloarcula marina TaxID=2961574 RepID=UPI0020B7F178|nr:hypothetical protein [Halomicroarcula marina]